MALGLTVQRLFIQHPDSPYSEMIEDPEMQPVKDVTSLELNLDGVGLYMHTASMGVQSVIGGGPAAQAASCCQFAPASRRRSTPPRTASRCGCPRP